MGSKVEDIRWSKRSYSLREALKRCAFPQIMKVSTGFVSSDDNETLSRDQILRIHQIHTQTRVLASVKKNKWLSIPLRYADARFEVITGKKRSKPMYMRDVIDRALLPQEAGFFLGDDLSFDLQTAKGGVAEKLSPLMLRNMYEVSYLQGNAIYHNHLDTQVVNIPLYLPIEVNLAEGFTKHSVEQWGRYQSLLEKLVSRHVTFELFPGNQNITFFSDKRIEKAESQEDYEKISPSGTLYIISAKERLRSKPSTRPTGGASRTVGHVPASSDGGPRARALSPVRAAATNRNADARKARHAPNPPSADTVPRQPRQPPGRTPQTSSQTMPRSILHKTPSPSNGRRNNNHAQPPPVPTSARPTNGSPMQDKKQGGAPFQNHSGNSRDVPHERGRDNRPQALPNTFGPGYRRTRSPSVEAMPKINQYPGRNRSPSVGDVHRTVLLSPTGKVKENHIRHSPGIINAFDRPRAPSSTSSTNSEYENLKSLPVSIPEPDYDPSESAFFPFPVTNKGREAGYGPPPTPPPIHTIPKAVPSVQQYAPPPGPSSSVPSTPPAPKPLAPAAPAPPSAPGPPNLPAPPPPPPPPPGLDWKPQPAPAPAEAPGSSKPAPKPTKDGDGTMESMMKELKDAHKRRMSRGMDLEDAVDGGRVVTNGSPNNSPRINTLGKPQSSSSTNELQAILKERKASLGVNQSPVNPLPVAPRPKPGGFRVTNPAASDNHTFNKVEDIPKQIKGLTVAQIAQCLRLLNLQKFIDTFQKNCIDGDFLMTLDKDMLRSDLGLSDFETQRIVKFIGGWRPK